MTYAFHVAAAVAGLCLALFVVWWAGDYSWGSGRW